MKKLLILIASLLIISCEKETDNRLKISLNPTSVFEGYINGKYTKIIEQGEGGDNPFLLEDNYLQILTKTKVNVFILVFVNGETNSHTPMDIFYLKADTSYLFYVDETKIKLL